MAERLARSVLADLPGMVAASAGTHARAGAPMHPPAAEALARRGIDASGFRSQPLGADAVRAASVVLTATREQRAAVVTMVPAAVRRTFTLRELARLAAAVGPGEVTPGPPATRLAGLLAAVPRARAALPPPTAEEDDLADPVAGTAADVWACVEEIARCLDRMFAVIAPR